MDKQSIIKMGENFVLKEDKMNIFEAPIFGFAATSDEYFKVFRQPGIIGEHFMLPEEWLKGSKTVLSFFLPFTEEVRKSNCKDMEWPSFEWLQGRIEGQAFLNKLTEHLKVELEKAGYTALIPAMDKRFWSKKEGGFTSNWSERHVAFVAGLGTFGLSKGLITKKGMAGRFGSIITDLELLPDKRDYEGIYEYCTNCGACAKNCPVGAISLKNGKNHKVCSDFQDITAEKYKPRYGCGKCQVKVPCESCIPKK